MKRQQLAESIGSYLSLIDEAEALIKGTAYEAV